MLNFLPIGRRTGLGLFTSPRGDFQCCTAEVGDTFSTESYLALLLPLGQAHAQLTFADGAYTADSVTVGNLTYTDVTLKSACLWSVFWVVVSVAFGIYLYVHHGSEMASLFFTGYVLEKVLSVDNMFLIMAVFSWFSIPNEYRHRVLYWGVLGAIVFRAVFVAIGTGLLSFGPYVEVLFAAMVA